MLGSTCFTFHKYQFLVYMWCQADMRNATLHKWILDLLQVLMITNMGTNISNGYKLNIYLKG